MSRVLGPECVNTFVTVLPAEIIDDILTRIHHADQSAFGSFRMSSRGCKSVADPVFYRQMILADVKHESSKERRKFQEYELKREVDFLTQARRTSIVHETVGLLLDPRKEMASFVRDLTIGPFVDGQCSKPSRCPWSRQCPLRESVLQVLLLKMNHLRVLRWSAGSLMPKSILRLLRDDHLSNCQLHVIKITRNDAKLDKQMLSLRNLHGLQFAVLNDYKVSEFPILDRILPDAENLESLALSDTLSGLFVNQKVEEEMNLLKKTTTDLVGPLRLITPLSRCRLKSLTLGGRLYLDKWTQHLETWVRGMDWSQLRQLDLENAIPRPILIGLTGKVPLLESIKLGAADDVYPQHVPLEEEEDYLRAFLLSAPGVRVVSMYGTDEPKFVYMLDTVTERSQLNLQALTIQSSLRLKAESFLWSGAQLGRYCTLNPGLRELAVELDLDIIWSDLSAGRPISTHDESWVRKRTSERMKDKID